MLLLAQMPAVIAPQHDDRVVTIRSVFERIEYATYHCIGESDRRQIALNSLLPLVVFSDVRKVAIGTAFFSSRRQVVQIVLFVSRRQLNVLDGERIEVLFRYKPRLMRSIDSASQKEWLIKNTSYFMGTENSDLSPDESAEDL